MIRWTDSRKRSGGEGMWDTKIPGWVMCVRGKADSTTRWLNSPNSELDSKKAKGI